MTSSHSEGHTVFCWEWDADGTWTQYPTAENGLLEAAWAAKQSSITFTIGDHDYTVENLQSVITSAQVNTKTKKSRPIRRSGQFVPHKLQHPIPRSDSGPCWQTPGHVVAGTDVVYHKLSPGTFNADRTKENEEWIKVKGQMREMCPNFQLDTVKAIYVYESANAKAKFRECRAAFDAAGKSTKEEFVFHGTPRRANADSIVQEGFRVGGQNGHAIAVGAVYGQGVYSDTDPMEPRRYGGFVIMCRGLPGKREEGAPRDSQFHDQGFDSWIPSNQPKWRVWKTSAQLLPAYVIEF